MATEVEVRGRWGEVIALAGNLPLALDNPAGAWRVEEGRAEVFAVPWAETGPRTHLCTVLPGELLLGAEAGASGLGLLAVGSEPTRLRRLDPDQLAAQAAEPVAAARLAAQIDAWLLRLPAEIVPAPAPKIFTELVAGAEIELDEAGRVARVREGVAWVRHLEGDSLLLGQERLAPASQERLTLASQERLTLASQELLTLADQPSPPVPLPEGLWLVAAGPARIAVAATRSLLGEEGFRQGLARFHELCLRLVAAELERVRERERERLGRRTERDGALLSGAYARLASVLERRSPEASVAAETGDPLLAACRLVGAAQGIEIRDRPESQAGLKQGDQLAQICVASRVRSRRVLLRDDWWRRDNGPLVGFRFLDAEQKERRAVALLPTSPQSYELVDPLERTRSPVDAALAERLAGDAHMFYPPLPERPVGKLDLLRLAFRDRRHDLTSIVAMGLCGGALALLLPILTGQVFGDVIPGADRGQLAQIAVALVAGAFAAAAFQVTRSIAVLRLGGKIDGTVQAAAWDRLLALPVSFFRRYSVGDLANRSLGIDAIRDLLAGNVLTSVLAGVFSLFSFALLFYYSWRLALVATALVVALASASLTLLWLQLRHQRELLRLQGEIASLLFGLFHGIAKLRVAAAEPRAFARWAARFTEQRRRALAARRVANLQAAFNAAYGVVASLVLFAVVGMASRETLPVGEFLAFNAAFGQFLAASLSMVTVVSSILALVPVYERLSPILAEPPEVDVSKAEPGELTGDLEFSHVSFRYGEDGPPVLDDVSFRAGAGEFIALVGPSGAGKSTCLRLILGFERPGSGSIYFDGQDLASLAVRSVRRQIGVVLQHGQPMAGSLFSNIVGSSNLSLDDAWEAARLAGLAEDIQAMPMGMHTIVSEGAGTFSGGQKQRLLIARAIVHRPRIVLFDEATSALDNRTQETVSRSLERLRATRVVIAHRLSTIQNADRIYVIDAGRVVESGTYEELLARGGAFARLAERQLL